MQKHIVSILAISVASAMLSVASVSASDLGTTPAKSAQKSRACRKVTVAAMSKSNDSVVKPADRESYFNNDFTAQHPSGGG